MTTVVERDPQRLAEGCMELMRANDRALEKLGISIDAVGPGTAQLSMTVDDTMVNGHDIAHGGFIFLLADSAFAYACNSRNRFAVGQFCNVAFVRAGKEGDRLTAVAIEKGLTGRSGVYDVSVRDQDGRTVAEFRGHSRTISGTYFPEEEPA